MNRTGWNLKYVIKQLVPPLLMSIKRALQPPPRVSKHVFDQTLEFTTDWFSRNEENWDRVLDDLKPERVLEIGSLEGMSTCYLIKAIAVDRKLEVHCIDTWEGGIEHQANENAPLDMSMVEHSFRANTRKCIESAPHPVDLHVHKCFSHRALSFLINEDFEQHFDLVYVDGSHQAPDVLVDAVLSFKLLRTGGILIFDDYLWEEELPDGTDPLRCPKPAIDAFVNLYIRKVKVLSAPLGQLYVRKISS